MENYVGEIRLFPGFFAPEGWQYCNGQLLSINAYPTLFQLLGTTYGGDGQTTFALPNLQSRAVVGLGNGPGLSSYTQGQMVGQENVTLIAPQLPQHQHTVQATLQAHTGTPGQDSPDGAYFGDQGSNSYGPNNGSAQLASGSVVGQTSATGDNQPHSNLQPLLAINYIIATGGIYPSQQ